MEAVEEIKKVSPTGSMTSREFDSLVSTSPPRELQEKSEDANYPDGNSPESMAYDETSMVSWETSSELLNYSAETNLSACDVDETRRHPMKRSVTFSHFPRNLTGITDRGGVDHRRLREVCGVDPEPPEFEFEELCSQPETDEAVTKWNLEAPDFKVTKKAQPWSNSMGAFQPPFGVRGQDMVMNMSVLSPFPLMNPGGVFSLTEDVSGLDTTLRTNSDDCFKEQKRHSQLSKSSNCILPPALFHYKMKGTIPKFKQLRGHVVEFCRDSSGSRFIQETMEKNASTKHFTASEVRKVVEEILQSALALMKDLFGNYVVQNLLDFSEENEKRKIIALVPGKMKELSFQAHGCRVVQKVLDLVDGPLRLQLTKELVFVGGASLAVTLENVGKVCTDQHASHVLQKCVELLQKDVYSDMLVKKRSDRFRALTTPAKKNTVDVGYLGYNPDTVVHHPANVEESAVVLRLIEGLVAREVKVYALHPNASRLLQKLLGDCNKQRNESLFTIVSHLEQNIPELAIDQHGNFILQHILDCGKEYQGELIHKYVLDNLIQLSQHKFGSHLGEKSLTSGSAKQIFDLTTVILGLASSSSSKETSSAKKKDAFFRMLKDPYANFVIQRALDVNKGIILNTLISEIECRADQVSKFTYGRHILSHLDKLEKVRKTSA